MSPTLPGHSTRTTLFADVQYGAEDGTPLHLDILRPELVPVSPMPVVVEIHGGAWQYGEKDPEQNILFAQHGFFTASINYRLSGQATFPAQIADAKAAIRWLRANAAIYNIDGDRIGVWGHSAGGHLSALLGTSGDSHEVDLQSANVPSSRVQAVVAVSPAINMVEHGWDHVYSSDDVLGALFGGPARAHMDLVRMANPITYLEGDAPPFLLIHGDQDEVVPVEQSDIFRTALQGANIDTQYMRIADGTHNLEGHWPEIHRQALAFFQKHLVERKERSDYD